MRTIERVIITALLRDMRAAGYLPAAIWEGEGYTMACGDVGCTESYARSKAPEEITRELTNTQVLTTLEEYDFDCTVHFTDKGARTWGLGVLLILGNGEDVISDYHVNEDLDRITDAISNRLDKGLAP